MFDITTLQLLKYKKYLSEYGAVALKGLEADKVSSFLVNCYTNYFKIYPTKDVIDLNTFYSHFCMTEAASLTKDEQQVYYNMFTQIMVDPPKTVTDTYLKSISERSLANKVTTAIEKYAQGEEIDLGEIVKEAVRHHDKTVDAHTEVQYVDVDIAKLIEEDRNNEGLKWRQASLNSMMRALRAGDFGIIAARPDKGKTTFIVDALTGFAPQIDDGRCIVYFNNEGLGERVKLRMVQSALNMTTAEVYNKAKQGKDAIDKMYSEALGGKNNIFIFDVHGKGTGYLERIIRKYNPQVVLYDMLDKVKFSGGSTAGARTDQMLEALYDWGREMAAIYKHVGIATSQLSKDAEDFMPFPPDHCLKDSKTGKQGACDFILVIGHNRDGVSGEDDARYFSLPKNKLKKEGIRSTRSGVVTIDPLRARYNDIAEET